MRYIPLVLFMVVGCSGIQHTYQPAVSDETSSDSGIIFFAFRIQKDSLSGSDSVSLLSSSRTAGRLKKEVDKGVPSNRIVVSLLNSEKKMLTSVIQEHPLIRSVETTNAQGQFEHKTLYLSKAEFFVRMTMRSDAAYVSIDEILGDKKTFLLDISLK